ncbi:MAG: GGDEF domain-containing protein [Methylococcales bacterium]
MSLVIRFPPLLPSKYIMPVYDEMLKNVYHPDHTDLLAVISTIVTPHCDQIAKNFYRILLNNPQAANYLNHDEVKKRLTASMAAWIRSLFIQRYTLEAINEFKSYQLKIGHIHGKIGLPVSLVNYGMYIIKQDILQALIDSELNRKELGDALIITNQILDCTLQVINESYEGDLVSSEKIAQAFKIQFSTHHLAFDCERLRTSLSDWMRDLLLNIQQDSFDVNSLLTIRQSNFGLWIGHKAKLFLANRQELTDLICLLDDMDETLQRLVKHIKDEHQRQELLKTLNVQVTKANWILGEVAKEIIDQDNGRDTLTRLFNRRFLDTVMRHETLSSLKNGVVFGVIAIDIDLFKQINDAYGHDYGDKVLTQLAEIFTHEVRAGDFIFRLGGEEFLIILGDVNSRVVAHIAENIRLAVGNTEFKSPEHSALSITVSIGTALYDRHPDFNRTIKLADEALYQAKQAGRNCVFAAKQEPATYANILKK